MVEIFEKCHVIRNVYSYLEYSVTLSVESTVQCFHWYVEHLPLEISLIRRTIKTKDLGEDVAGMALNITDEGFHVYHF